MINPFGGEWIKNITLSLYNLNVELRIEDIGINTAELAKINLRCLLSQWPRLRYSFSYLEKHRTLKLMLYHCPPSITKQFENFVDNIHPDKMKEMAQRK